MTQKHDQYPQAYSRGWKSFFKTTLCVQLGTFSILAFSECIWDEAEYFFGLQKGVECADSHKDR